MRRGRRAVLKCFLHVYALFYKNDGSPCYILNELCIKDYCIWLHSSSVVDSLLTSLADAAKSIRLSKKDANLELDELELAASLVLAEEGSVADAERPTSSPDNDEPALGELSKEFSLLGMREESQLTETNESRASPENKPFIHELGSDENESKGEL